MSEEGFDYKGVFYPLSISSIGKDLMLIDRVSGGIPLPEFMDLLDDDIGRGRSPVQLTLIATSIRKANPDWSVERIVRIIEDLDMGADVHWINANEEAELPPTRAEPSTGGNSASPSRSTSSGPVPVTSATSNATPA